MNKYLKILCSGICVLAVIAILLSYGHQPEPFVPGSASAQRLLSGPFEWSSHDEVFFDDTRPSQAHGSYAGVPMRRLETTLWYPDSAAQGPYPLLLYSHGFSSMRSGGAYLARHLASHGYVVAAPNFPLTHIGAPDRPFVRDVVNQPGDVSFLIDELLQQSAGDSGQLAGKVDPQRIGVTGISLGGMTSTLLAFHPEMRDERIAAALSIAGPTAPFTAHFFASSAVAFLMLAGDIDVMVPHSSNAAPVPEKVPGGQLVTIANASHTGFSGPAAPLRWLSNPDMLGCYVVNRNIADDAQEPWYELLGTPEQGIDYRARSELCRVDPLPPAMNPLRQHMIATVVVRAFFDSQFADTGTARAEARHYLAEVLAAELSEVSYASAAGSDR